MLATSADLCDLSKVPQDATKLIDQSVVINHSQLEGSKLEFRR